MYKCGQVPYLKVLRNSLVLYGHCGGRELKSQRVEAKGGGTKEGKREKGEGRAKARSADSLSSYTNPPLTTHHSPLTAHHSPLTRSDRRRHVMQCTLVHPIHIHPKLIVMLRRTHPPHSKTPSTFHLPITCLSTSCHLTHSSLDELSESFLAHQSTFITRPHDFSS